MLTPKSTRADMDSGKQPVVHSAIIEDGFAASPLVPATCTISVWVKLCGTVKKPMADQTHWYHLLIQRRTTDVKIYLNGTYHADYTGAVGTHCHELLEAVTTLYGGSAKAYYSALIVLEGIHDPSRFGLSHPDHPDYFMPRQIYGTAISHLKFDDTSNLGKATSGAEWSIKGQPIQTVDWPCNNYYVLDPASTTAVITLSKGNRVASTTNVWMCTTRGTMLVTSGQWYVEFAGLDYNNNKDGMHFGVGEQDFPTGGFRGNIPRFSGIYAGLSAPSAYVGKLGSSTRQDKLNAPLGEVARMAYNPTTHSLYYGTSKGWLDATGKVYPSLEQAPPLVTGVGLQGMYVVLSVDSVTARLNTGSTAWAYDPPEGYLPLSTANLPDNHPDKFRNAAITL